MNARQKAKKYKKELDWLKHRLDPSNRVQYQTRNLDIVNLAAEKSHAGELVRNISNDRDLVSFVAGELCRMLVNDFNFRQCTNLDEIYDPIRDVYTYRLSMRLVKED